MVQINITATFYLFAALQAILLLVVIIRKDNKGNSERCLATILGMLAVTLIHYVIVMNDLLPMRNILMDVSAISWLTISPLIYLYCRFLTKHAEKWRWNMLWYFVPSLYLVAQMLLIPIGNRIGLYLLFSDWNTYTTAWIMGYLLNSLIFSILSLRVLFRTKVTNKQAGQLKWLRLYLKISVGLLIGAIALLFYWWNAAVFIAQFEYLLLCCYAIFVFGLAFKSLRFSSFFTIIADNHYQNEQKDHVELANLYQQLEDYVQKKQPYLQPKLTLKNLATATNIPENQLSQIFTRHLNSNFYHYINRYRLCAFEEEIKTKGTDQYTIMALAESAGFSSKATFYKVFKMKYGMTPTQYLKQEKILS